ncbi:MAG: ribosome small subunit-dependent GTPase A [Elusimicrobia bacterium]|nr:ribosome small subunit-dependent GTPase A [Elusimicrobiota bacterium]
MPKQFDASAEDWVEGFNVPARRKFAKRPLKGRGRELPAAEGNSTVAEIFPNQALVLADVGRTRKLCGYRLAALDFAGISRERSPVCVGDRVRVEARVIVGRCERRNKLVRCAPESRNPLLHAVAANLDCLVVVAAAREPDFTPGIVDRFLVAASAQNIPGILCVNKADLVAPGAEKPWLLYASAGVKVVETSAVGGDGTDALAALLRGQTVAFCGHSGVGKTSLLRRLLGDDRLGRVGAISAATGLGRHTTSGAVMLLGPDGSAWIDTPGIMNFALVGVDRPSLLLHFPELHEASARCSPNCLHDSEPGCALLGMPRHQSYRQILSSL